MISKKKTTTKNWKLERNIYISIKIGRGRESRMKKGPTQDSFALRHLDSNKKRSMCVLGRREYFTKHLLRRHLEN
jgi:hypothetical protein